ncbi:hypothetical protein BY996DRAFT_6645662 [Phakopsora pachyrhizi]|uniref:Secreted protein n=1 Tax=Phakopsora pachyrhizi TaxID=170000 RepID=A0A0S1MJC8_PHAPC|nr:hypothetical protein BY996DRAFT_6645662 [Phakopsora pachyrhizi]
MLGLTNLINFALISAVFLGLVSSISIPPTVSESLDSGLGVRSLPRNNEGPNPSYDKRQVRPLPFIKSLPPTENVEQEDTA